MSAGSVIRAEKENVLISAGDCTVTLRPDLGGKIASIRIQDRELLQSPLSPYAPRTRSMSFDAGDASGWDECLPSVAACELMTAAGRATIPDHGDLWRVDWETVETLANRVVLKARCFSVLLELERCLELNATSTGWRLRLDYTLNNVGDHAVPWSWAAHPLFAADAGDKIVLPDSIHSLRLEGSGGNRLGRGGDTVRWPMATLTTGETTDLSVAQSIDSNIGDKLFAGPLSLEENWCALERPAAGVRIRVGFDAAATPYLGLWICYGGWPDRPGPKQMCVALEPSTALVDSLAVTGAWSRVLDPGSSTHWTMTVDLERI